MLISYCIIVSFSIVFVSAVPNPVWSVDAVPQNATLAIRDDDPSALRLQTCGYHDGKADSFRTANSGYDCRFDSKNQLWGYCPESVIYPRDCGLAGACIDEADCSQGCGKTKDTALTTFTCKSKDYCSTAILTLGQNQAYTYIACGAAATTDNYYISPTSTTQTPTPSALPFSAPKKTASTTTEPSQISSSASETISTTPDASSSADASDTSKDSPRENNTPAIIGGVIGGLALLGIFALTAIYLIRRDRASKTKTADAEPHKRVTIPEAENQAAEKMAAGGWAPRELPAERHGHDSPSELPG